MPGRTPNSAAMAAATRLRALSADLMKIVHDLGDALSVRDAHRLRTSIRRIEVATESAARSSGTKKLQRQLDTLRRTAGRVRDIDVQTELLHDLNAGDYERERDTLNTLLLRRRQKLEQKAIAVVTKELDKGLEERLESAAKSLETAAPRPRVASKERVERVREQYIEFTKEIPVDGDPLHDLRKASKRLRYRLEAIPGRESRTLERDLKIVQDAVGHWHDWATLTEEAQERLDPRSIAFVAFLRSLTIAKRHEARRAVKSLRDKLIGSAQHKKPPARAKFDQGLQTKVAR